ncbi:MAG: hypothetical protein ABSG01_09020 [Anaerolineales bacterium]|jgi:hypothetical protein
MVLGRLRLKEGTEIIGGEYAQDFYQGIRGVQIQIKFIPTLRSQRTWTMLFQKKMEAQMMKATCKHCVTLVTVGRQPGLMVVGVEWCTNDDYDL